MSEAANALFCEQHLHFHLIANRPMMYVLGVAKFWGTLLEPRPRPRSP